MTRRMTVLVAGAAVAALGLTACSGGSGSGTAAGGASSGDSAKKVTSIKLVAAEYSKDHTAAFWKRSPRSTRPRPAPRWRSRSSAGTTSTSRAAR